jgi:hypothetical protein
MTTNCKCTITRPNLDSLFVFELAYGFPGCDIVMIDRHPRGRTVEALHADTFILESKLSDYLNSDAKIILDRYEEFIYWNEVIERKNELRPDIKYRLDQLGILDRSTDLSIYGEGPNFNPFSLTHTRTAKYETFEDWELNYHYVFDNFNTKSKDDLKNLLNTVHEELYIDGVLTEYNNFKQLW